MDSITQASLGAAVAYASWHRQLGKPALLWGAAIGTIPDLDVLLYPFLDDIQRLYWHRGESHSLAFTIIGSFLISWLLWKRRWKNKITFYRVITGVFLVIATHITIDYFNVYGTQLLEPFSRYGFAHGNMFIIDPLYTLPLLAGIFLAGIDTGKFGWKGNTVGLIISSLYALFSIVSHTYADYTFKQQLEENKVEVFDSITGASPMNTLLWRHIARTDEGILIGYFSIIGNHPCEGITFDLVKRNDSLLAPFKDQRNVKAVKWFSKGFWVAQMQNDVVTLSDLRFGEFRSKINAPSDEWQYIFSWKVSEAPDILTRNSPSIRDSKAAVTVLWKRLIGACLPYL